jgi:hypothetical protein
LNQSIHNSIIIYNKYFDSNLEKNYTPLPSFYQIFYGEIMEEHIQAVLFFHVEKNLKQICCYLSIENIERITTSIQSIS